MTERGHDGAPPPPVRPLDLLADLLAWPRGIARLGAVLCAAVAGAFALGYLPSALRSLGDEAARNSALSYADREIAGGNSIVPDQQAVYQARALIPSGDSYRVAVGPNLRKSTPLTLNFVASWLTSFLLPRRPAADARWIVCVGCDTAGWGSRYRILWQDDVGISIGRLAG